MKDIPAEGPTIKDISIGQPSKEVELNFLALQKAEPKKAGGDLPKPIDKPWDGPHDPNPKPNGSHGGDGRTPPLPHKKSDSDLQTELNVAASIDIYGAKAPIREVPILIAQSGDATVDQYEKIQHAKRDGVNKVIHDTQEWNRQHGIVRGSPEPLINTNHRHPSAGLELQKNPLSTKPAVWHPYNGHPVQRH